VFTVPSKHIAVSVTQSAAVAHASSTEPAEGSAWLISDSSWHATAATSASCGGVVHAASHVVTTHGSSRPATVRVRIHAGAPGGASQP
jgi:hypothetical protein